MVVGQKKATKEKEFSPWWKDKEHANSLSDTYMFYVSSFKPAQDPWQLIYSGKGGAFNPHGLKHGRMEGRKEEKSLMNLI